MRILGVSAGFHDAALTVLHNHKVLFAGHAERYSKIKNDSTIPISLQEHAKTYGPFDKIVYYEKPHLRQLRKIKSGESWGGAWRTRTELEQTIPYIMETTKAKISSVGHHLSHAAAGFQTSPFDDATVVVIDAIGESDTISIYHAYYNGACLAGEHAKANYKLLYKQSYPHSIGMFYSAVTKRCGLRPMDEEYITMGMAAYGDADKAYNTLKRATVQFADIPLFKENLHIGIDDVEFAADVTAEDIAAAGQQLCEEMVMSVMRRAKALGTSKNLVYMGGVALNCVANSKIRPLFDDMWIFPNPGDAGSALGCILAHTKKKLHYPHTFWGENIIRDLDVRKIVKKLVYKKVCGVANGQAEFGPRALGNRSLLADVRTDVKDTVNEIKRRQKFRPFATAILEEFYDEYFEGYANEYMQFVSKAKHDYTSVTHVDGTARVQVVKNDGSNLRKILEYYYEVSKVPMLLNTSLNIKGQPIVNTWEDAKQFQTKYGVDVL